MPWTDLVSFTLAYYQFSRVDAHADIALADLVRRLRKTPREHRNLAYVLDAFYRYETKVLRGSETLRWGDKTPANIFAMEQIREVFPDARFIHLYRDGCDVVHSLVDKGMCEDALVAADRWVSSVNAARRFARSRHGHSLMSLKYEDFVADPEPALRQLCAFVSLQYTPVMLQEGEPMRDAVGQSHTAINPMLGAGISTQTIGSGRERLGRAELEALAPVLDRWLEELGYARCRS